MENAQAIEHLSVVVIAHYVTKMKDNRVNICWLKQQKKQRLNQSTYLNKHWDDLDGEFDWTAGCPYPKA
jgi:hypothetical protein